VKDTINDEFYVRHFRMVTLIRYHAFGTLLIWGNRWRGDDNKTIEDSIRIGGALLILGRKQYRQDLRHIMDDLSMEGESIFIILVYCLNIRIRPGKYSYEGILTYVKEKGYQSNWKYTNLILRL